MINKEWEEKYNLLIEYINSSEEIKEYFEKTGTINARAIMEKNGEKIKIGTWLNNQKVLLMKKNRNITIDNLDERKDISEDNKYKFRKLLELGVKIPDYKADIEEKNWEEKYDALVQYINSSKKIKEEFKEKGYLTKKIIVEKNGKSINLSTWVYSQRTNLMKKYQEMTSEQIEEDEKIPQIDKYRMLKLLKLGITYIKIEEKTKDQIWDEKYELLVEYINSSKTIKKDFSKRGTINQDTIIEKNGKKIKLGKWVLTQRKDIMRKYQGMTVDQIKSDENISKKDKYRMEKLLKLGVIYLRTEEKPYDKQWEERYELLKEYINSSEEIGKYFNKNGRLPTDTNIAKDGKIINLSEWLDNQKYYLIERNNGKSITSIEEIEKNEKLSETDKIKILKFLELGVKLNFQQKTNKEIWDEKYKVLVQYINSTELIQKQFEASLTIPANSIVNNNGNKINLNTWLNTQKQNLIKKYEGKSLEEIEQNKKVPEFDKYRLKKLSEIGLTTKRYKTGEKIHNIEKWNKKFDLLVDFINSDEEVKAYFHKKGTIKSEEIIINDDEEINIGLWINNQRQVLMRKYQGKTIKQIKNNKKIPETDKYKMEKLLSLGVSYKKIGVQTIGKATYDISVEECDKIEEEIRKYKEQKKKGKVRKDEYKL